MHLTRVNTFLLNCTCLHQVPIIPYEDFSRMAESTWPLQSGHPWHCSTTATPTVTPLIASLTSSMICRSVNDVILYDTGSMIWRHSDAHACQRNNTNAFMRKRIFMRLYRTRNCFFSGTTFCGHRFTKLLYVLRQILRNLKHWPWPAHYIVQYYCRLLYRLRV